MSDRLKILYVANVRMPNERAHGIQIINTCLNLFGKDGTNLMLVTPMFTGSHSTISEHYDLPQPFLHKKIFAIDVPHLPGRFLVRSISFFISVNIYILIAFLWGFTKGEKLVVYVRGELILALIPLAYIVPIFFETHQIRNHEYLYRIALGRVCGVVVITDALKKKFIEQYGLDPRRILVARDAVDQKRFQIESNRRIWQQHGISDEKRVVLYSGTLSQEKGVYTLADAASQVSPDVQIVFLGGTEKQVESFKNLYGGRSNISILGRVNYSEVPQYVSSADVLVIPDSAENMFSNLYTSPMKLFEYMATGRPIISSKVPSLLEVLNEENAFFFDPDNSQSLAQTIKSVLSNKEDSMKRGKRAQHQVSEFTWEKRSDLIIKHIRVCLNLSCVH